MDKSDFGSLYKDYRCVRDLMREYMTMRSKVESDQLSEEVLSVLVDIERAFKRITPYERDLVYKNCLLRRPAHSIAKDYDTYQAKISLDIIRALCKMSVFLSESER